MARWIGLLAFALIVIPSLPAAAQKLPSAHQGSRDAFLYDGKQNYPFKLYGVATKWHLDCLKGKAAECVRLAEAFEAGLGDLAIDRRAAAGYWMLACQKGAAAACAHAAGVLRDNSLGFTNEEKAQELAVRGCEALKHQPSCAAMAVGMARGPAADPVRAAAVIDEACASGSDDGCRLKASGLFYDSKDVASRARALPMFEKACADRQAWGCLGLAEAYGQGIGVAADPARAARHAETGCVSGRGNRLRLCTLHGMRLSQASAAATVRKGEQFLAASCRGGDPVACNRIGTMGVARAPGAASTVGEGLYYLRRACDLELGEGCANLARAYAAGTRVTASPATAWKLHERACRFGYQPGCAEARRAIGAEPGLRARVSPDPSSTVSDQLKAAKALAEGSGSLAARSQGVAAVIQLMYEGSEDAEWLLGGWLYYGLPGIYDTSRRAEALVLFENAARVGHVDAAIFMGMAYWYGQDGLTRDRAKGEGYMQVAAKRGSEKAAAIHRSMRAEPVRERREREIAEWEKWQREYRGSWAYWISTLNTGPRPSSYRAPSYSGPSVSSIIDESNWSQRISYLSGGTTACPASNPYCR